MDLLEPPSSQNPVSNGSLHDHESPRIPRRAIANPPGRYNAANVPDPPPPDSTALNRLLCSRSSFFLSVGPSVCLSSCSAGLLQSRIVISRLVILDRCLSFSPRSLVFSRLFSSFIFFPFFALSILKPRSGWENLGKSSASDHHQRASFSHLPLKGLIHAASTLQTPWILILLAAVTTALTNSWISFRTRSSRLYVFSLLFTVFC